MKYAILFLGLVSSSVTFASFGVRGGMPPAPEPVAPPFDASFSCDLQVGNATQNAKTHFELSTKAGMVVTQEGDWVVERNPRIPNGAVEEQLPLSWHLFSIIGRGDQLKVQATYRLKNDLEINQNEIYAAGTSKISLEFLVTHGHPVSFTLNCERGN